MHRQTNGGGIIDSGIDIENDWNTFGHRTRLSCLRFALSTTQPATGGVSVICDSVTTSINQGLLSASAFASAGSNSPGSVILC